MAATNSQRIAELEREFAELRREIRATEFLADIYYRSGFREGVASITGQPRRGAAPRPARSSHLHSVEGAR